MNAFQELRQQARERRDRIIAQARSDYDSALAKIADLESSLTSREQARGKTIAAAIDALIPKDDSFTTESIIKALEASEPGRVWRKRSIDTHFQYLRKRGVIRRIRRAKTHQPAVYVRSHVQVEEPPFEGKTLVDAMKEVLAARQPMRPVELAVALLEAGYQTRMEDKRFRSCVAVSLRKNLAFVKDSAEKWGVVQEGD